MRSAQRIVGRICSDPRRRPPARQPSGQGDLRQLDAEATVGRGRQAMNQRTTVEVSAGVANVSTVSGPSVPSASSVPPEGFAASDCRTCTLPPGPLTCSVTEVTVDVSCRVSTSTTPGLKPAKSSALYVIVYQKVDGSPSRARSTASWCSPSASEGSTVWIEAITGATPDTGVVADALGSPALPDGSADVCVPCELVVWAAGESPASVPENNARKARMTPMSTTTATAPSTIAVGSDRRLRGASSMPKSSHSRPPPQAAEDRPARRRERRRGHRGPRGRAKADARVGAGGVAGGRAAGGPAYGAAPPGAPSGAETGPGFPGARARRREHGPVPRPPTGPKALVRPGVAGGGVPGRFAPGSAWSAHADRTDWRCTCGGVNAGSAEGRTPGRRTVVGAVRRGDVRAGTDGGRGGDRRPDDRPVLLRRQRPRRPRTARRSGSSPTARAHGRARRGCAARRRARRASRRTGCRGRSAHRRPGRPVRRAPSDTGAAGSAAGVAGRCDRRPATGQGRVQEPHERDGVGADVLRASPPVRPSRAPSSARPVTRTRPSGATCTPDGRRVRWCTPRRRATSSAAAASPTSARAWSAVSGPRRRAGRARGPRPARSRRRPCPRASRRPARAPGGRR